MGQSVGTTRISVIVPCHCVGSDGRWTATPVASTASARCWLWRSRLSREQLWHAMPNDDSSDNIDRAIDVHISRLRALIEDNPRQPKRIITVRGVGYQFATDQV